jgi:hypothetical protein
MLVTRLSRRGFYPAGVLTLLAFLSGCTSNIQVSGDVAQGRQSLFKGDNPTALGYFQNAAQIDPQYVHGTELREGVLSYLGRAQYLNGQTTPAHQTLEKAIAQHRTDNVAVLYLGLTVAREGDRDKGLQQIQTGMKGIRDFLNYITTSFGMEWGQYWDPDRDIRNAIDNNLKMISAGNFDWATLVANSEQIGLNIEREPDRALQMQQQQQFNGQGR